MKLHESIGRGASKNKSMGMRDAHSIPLIVFSVMKKFVDQVCPHFPVLGDVNPGVFTFYVPSMKSRLRPNLKVRHTLYYVRYRLDMPATAFGHSFWPS